MSSKNGTLVVGAGIVGLAIAWRLQDRGEHVTIVDPLGPGGGASYGNAGAISSTSIVPLALPGIIKSVPSMLLDPRAPLHVPVDYWVRAMPWFIRFVAASNSRRVHEITEAMYRLHWDAVERHARFTREIGVPDLITTRGHLYVYRSCEQLAKDETGWSIRKRFGARVETLDRNGILDLEPEIGPNYVLGRFLPDHGHCVDPNAYCQAIARAITIRGGALVRDRVKALHARDGSIAEVEGEAARYSPARIVVAAGAHSSELLAPLGFRVPLETQRGYHIMLPPDTLDVSRCVVPADRKIFITPMASGVRVAGTVEFGGTRRPPTPARAALLKKDVADIFPRAPIPESDAFWMGHRPCLPDSLPVIGSSSRLPNLYFAFGHGHLGLTGAIATADHLSASMNADHSNHMSLDSYSIDRF